MRAITLALAASLVSFSASASSCNVSMINMHLDDAKTALRRISSTSDLEDAKSYARRLKNAADMMEMEVTSCDCTMAWSEFSDAATKARRARDASDAEDFVSNVRRSARAISDGIDAFNLCQSSR